MSGPSQSAGNQESYDTPRISEAEWEVMKQVWEAHPVTASDLVEKLGPARGWSGQTVKTLISRLVKKEVLGFEVQGKRYHYYPKVTQEDCVAAESQSFLSRVFGGSPSPLLAHFVQRSELGREEIEGLQKLLAAKEKQADANSRRKE